MKPPKYFVFLLIIFLNSFNSFALEIKRVQGFFYGENQVLVNVYFENFPFQELLLALKAQKDPILIEYDFEIYKKRFLLPDILLNQEKYYQKIFYDPEKNLYYIEDNFGLKSFKKAEDTISSIFFLESYPLKLSIGQEKKSLTLKIKVSINYKTHLSEEFKYTKKIFEKKLKIDKKFDFDEILAEF